MKRIDFETAKLAKEKGFNISFEEPPLAYTDAGTLLRFGYYQPNNINFIFAAPYQTELQKWLRNEHKIWVNVEFESYLPDVPKYYAEIKSLNSKNMGERLLDGFSLFKTYEEALEQGLLEALKLLI